MEVFSAPPAIDPGLLGLPGEVLWGEADRGVLVQVHILRQLDKGDIILCWFCVDMNIVFMNEQLFNFKRLSVQLLVPFIMGRHHHLVFNLVFTQNYSYVFLRYPISLQHWLNAVSGGEYPGAGHQTPPTCVAQR